MIRYKLEQNIANHIIKNLYANYIKNFSTLIKNERNTQINKQNQALYQRIYTNNK